MSLLCALVLLDVLARSLSIDSYKHIFYQVEVAKLVVCYLFSSEITIGFHLLVCIVA
jgi:hypothetical protein